MTLTDESREVTYLNMTKSKRIKFLKETEEIYEAGSCCSLPIIPQAYHQIEDVDTRR
jgi:hypothetical protein